ncbi:hypothetical protein PLEI_1464 [Photobacterium leiognathi lrivu.4.1]|uniref:Uncharacterized protein n=1 Tax=Photobacterium leiognathi lrivu.4.1 TaxID=1248232 RepID=A0A0U1P541_PHOLE|nr:hypothetical protein [Photobacterium leiognathi]GAD29811.1 hypothetical protein PLEI_1464 [Photobacterium leiognathi lrivu.4.1]
MPKPIEVNIVKAKLTEVDDVIKAKKARKVERTLNKSMGGTIPDCEIKEVSKAIQELPTDKQQSIFKFVDRVANVLKNKDIFVQHVLTPSIEDSSLVEVDIEAKVEELAKQKAASTGIALPIARAEVREELKIRGEM